MDSASDSGSYAPNKLEGEANHYLWTVWSTVPLLDGPMWPIWFTYGLLLLVLYIILQKGT